MKIDSLIEKIIELKELNERFQDKTTEIISTFQHERIIEFKELKEEFSRYPETKKEEVRFIVDSYENLDYCLKSILKSSQRLTEMILYSYDMSKYTISKDFEGIQATRKHLKQDT